MIKVFILVLASCFTQGLLAAETNPQVLIEQTASQVLKEIKANSTLYNEDANKLYDLVERTVLKHFDFDAMTELALGRFSKDVSAAQKPLIVQEFRALLVRTYGKALLEYNDQKIIYLPMEGTLASGAVTVRTEIEQGGGFPIPLNYSLRHGDQGWMVYDISVDGISLVTNYRSSFARQINKDGIDGLIQTLRERNQQ